MPEIEITEECRALIAAEFPFEETVRRLRNGEWQMQIDAETWQRLQKVRRHGETIGAMAASCNIWLRMAPFSPQKWSSALVGLA